MVNLGSLWSSLAMGFLLAGVIAGAAHRGAALSRSGFVSALFVGTITFGFGGPSWGVLLVSFFVSSSLLSRLGRGSKREAVREHKRGSRRDAWQVLANGGLGAMLAVLSRWGAWEWVFPAFVGSMAAVTADTWATEVGTLGQSQPRLITTGRQVVPGTSGAVSALGTSASIVGAVFIGAVAVGALAIDPAGGVRLAPVWVIAGAVAGGLIGSLGDSVVGATAQTGYYCGRCGASTERTVHRCGSRATRVKGISWVNNDVANFVSSVLGAAAGVGLWAAWRY